jgi:hypothetical protein
MTPNNQAQPRPRFWRASAGALGLAGSRASGMALLPSSATILTRRKCSRHALVPLLKPAEFPDIWVRDRPAHLGGQRKPERVTVKAKGRC